MAGGLKREKAKHNPFASANAVGMATITVGAEVADVINVGIQLKSVNGVNLGSVGHVRAYLSDSADGSDIAVTAPDTVAIGTDGLAIEIVSKKYWELISEDDGHIDINITENGADTWYLHVLMPDGSLVSSSAITFAA